MPIFSRLRDQRYCAFCKTLRRIYKKKHVDVTNVACAVAFAVTVTYALWNEAEPRGLVIFCLFIVGAEIFVYARWRMTLKCRMCGFDPLLYKKSPALAAARVKEFFKEQVENPQFMLTKSPLLTLQKRVRDQEKKAQAIEHMNQRSSLAHSKSL